MTPRRAGLYLQRAAYHEANDSIEEALADYKAALTIRPRDGEALSKLSKLYFILDNSKEALLTDSLVEELTRSLCHVCIWETEFEQPQLDDGSAKKQNSEGAQQKHNGPPDKLAEWVISGKYREAIGLLARSINQNPSAESFRYRGCVYAITHHYDDALHDLNQAISLDDKSPAAFLARGAVYNATDDSRRSLEDFSRAIELDRDSALAYYGQGCVHRWDGEWDEAISSLTKAIEKNPDLGQAFFQRGLAYEKLGKTDKAIADYTNAINLRPDFSYAHLRRMFLYRSKGDLVNAIQDGEENKKLRGEDGWRCLSRCDKDQKSAIPKPQH